MSKALRKTVATLVAVAMIAVMPLSAFACTGLYAGSATTANGSSYFGRSEDYGPDYAKVYRIVQAGDCTTAKPDDYGFSYVPAGKTLRYSVVQDLVSAWYTDDAHNNAPYVEAGTNEKGVSITETVSTYYNSKVGAADPLIEKGAIGEISIGNLVLQEATSARNGVELLGSLITKYGAAECNLIYIGDKNETWCFEVVSGHQWVATKMSKDKVAVTPNTIMTDAVDVTSSDIIASKDLIKTAKDGGFYVAGTAGNDNTINVAKSYSVGYDDYESYRIFYGTYKLNKDLALKMDPVLTKTLEDTNKIYPYADSISAPGPFTLQFAPSADMMGKIDLMTLKDVLGTHGEGTAYPTTGLNNPIRSIGTYRQVEDHFFESRASLPTSIATIEWLAMGPAEFSVFVPLYSAAMTEAPAVYNTTKDTFDKNCICWVYNELGKAGNSSYYLLNSKTGVYTNRYGKTVDPAKAKAVNAYLDKKGVPADLRAFSTDLQTKVNAMAKTNDDAIKALAAKGATDAEITAAANKYAQEVADYAFEAGTTKLASVDKMVKSYLKTQSIRLNKKAVTLKVGHSTTAVKLFKATITGDKIASVSVSNDKVVKATVNKKGTLTIKALSKGTAVVTVTSGAGYKSSVKVTVTK